MIDQNKSNTIKTGTTQENRFIKALDNNYVKVDEKSFEDLLVFSLGFSKLINYYGLDDKVRGDWSDFLNDETVVLASIIDSDPAKTETRFKDHLQKASLFKRKEKKQHYRDLCFEEIYRVALKFNAWLVNLHKVEEFTNTSSTIKNEIVSAITSKLGPALRSLVRIQLQESTSSEASQNVLAPYTPFDPVWELIQVDSSTTALEKEKVDNTTEKLQQIFQAFYETLLYLKRKAPDYLHQSMQSDNHYPEVALFIAFLKLYKITQGNLNNFTGRHLEFYYNTLLQQKNKNAIPDKVFLKLTSDDSLPFAEVKKGTPFLAGEDEFGMDIIYEADYSLKVNKAKLKNVHTIYLHNRKLNVRGEEKKVVSNILSADIPLLEATPENFKSTLRKTYPTFGEDQSVKGHQEKNMNDAEVGFAIASPSLLLSEGDRSITITFRFQPDTFSIFVKHLDEIGHATQNSRNEVFLKSFVDAFYIYFTTSEGWYEKTKYVAVFNEGKAEVAIKLGLDSQEPSIISYDKGLHGGNYETKLPVAKFILNSDSFVYPYTLLNDVVLDQIAFDTKVRGVKNLQLYNNIGQLSPSNPFFPFGPTPHAGSYLIVGSNEIFQKSLDDLKINVEWFDLPQHKSGFFEHYKEYNLDITNDSFDVNLSILNNGRWIPSNEDQQTFKLFRTVDKKVNEAPTPQGTLRSETEISNIDIKKIKQPADYAKINEPLNYSNLSQRGFIKLELKHPQFGFAHSIYPSVLSEVAIENSKSGILKNSKKKEMPKMPYTPQVKSISLDYSSSSVISFRNGRNNKSESGNLGKLVHIMPFGEHVVYPNNAKLSTYLLPEFNFEGALLLGFADLNPPQTITLLFEMLDEYTVSSEEDPPVIEWSYLKDNEWHFIPPSRIVRDDTNGFLKTGIIAIELPHDLTNNNTILNKGLFWIRASVLKNIEVASKTVSIMPHVITATLSPKVNLTGKHLDQPLPAFTIKRSVNFIPGIQKIIQPLESFGGRHQEKPKEFFTRVSERLRHKSRAITAWDYERLVLEKFPEVYKVTCLPNMNSNKMDAPGNVLAVITPYANHLANPYEPMASSELLYNIKSYLQENSSPFVQVEVRNPHYERIKVMCAVQFKEGYNYGYYLQKLNEELNTYLIGDIAATQRNFQLGGKINSSDVLSFMRTLPYVDFVTQFSMFQAARDFGSKFILLDTAREGEEKSSLQATKPWSVLIPAATHQFYVLNEKREHRSRQAGIEYLQLGEDFIIE